MKTLEQIKELYKSKCMDGRDIDRLVDFYPVSEWEHFGFKLKEGATPPIPLAFTRENIISKLKDDVEFGFEKALNKRGISSSFMAEVVQMWNWILEEGLEDFDEYPMYGLPIFKATAVKYGFDNPIGDDSGSEPQYNEY